MSNIFVKSHKGYYEESDLQGMLDTLSSDESYRDEYLLILKGYVGSEYVKENVRKCILTSNMDILDKTSDVALLFIRIYELWLDTKGLPIVVKT